MEGAQTSPLLSREDTAGPQRNQFRATSVSESAANLSLQEFQFLFVQVPPLLMPNSPALGSFPWLAQPSLWHGYRLWLFVSCTRTPFTTRMYHLAVCNYNLRTSKPAENFYKSLFEPNKGYLKQDNRPRKCFSEWHFAGSFKHLELRREGKEDYTKVDESKVGNGLQDS